MFFVVFVGLCVDVAGLNALFTRQIDRENVPLKTEPTCILASSEGACNGITLYNNRSKTSVVNRQRNSYELGQRKFGSGYIIRAS